MLVEIQHQGGSIHRLCMTPITVFRFCIRHPHEHALQCQCGVNVCVADCLALCVYGKTEFFMNYPTYLDELVEGDRQEKNARSVRVDLAARPVGVQADRSKLLAATHVNNANYRTLSGIDC